MDKNIHAIIFQLLEQNDLNFTFLPNRDMQNLKKN